VNEVDHNTWDKPF